MQLLKERGINCFSVYRVESLQVHESNLNTTHHGLQIPKHSQTNNIIQLSLTVDSDLEVNKQYYVIITALNANGEADYNVTVDFGKY